MESVPHKHCLGCGVLKPITEFTKEKRGKYGVKSRCRECKKLYQQSPQRKIVTKRYRQSDKGKQKRREVQRNYNHSEKGQQCRKEYYADPDVKEARRAYQQSPKFKMEQKRYQQSAKGRLVQRATSARRRARKQGCSSAFTKDDVVVQYQSQKGLCWWCSKPLNGKYHVDHRIALNKGGANDARNIVCACAECNYSKGAKMSWEWNGRLL